MLRRHALACPLVGGADEGGWWSSGRLRFLRQKRKPCVIEGGLPHKHYEEKKTCSGVKPSGNWTRIFKCIQYVFVYWEATEFQPWCDWISRDDLSISLSWLSSHTASPSSAKATLREESHRVQVHGSVEEAKKKKNVLKAVAVIYAKCYGKERNPKGRSGEGFLLWGTSICRLGQVNSREEVKFLGKECISHGLWRLSKTWACG